MITRQSLEERERMLLAHYGMRSGDSRGRIYPEEEHEYRTVYQRDRDRIIHTTAFRRLEYKTQVFVYSEGDHYRNRLTHSIDRSGARWRVPWAEMKIWPRRFALPTIWGIHPLVMLVNRRSIS